MKIKFEIETGSGKKLSFSDLKKKAKGAIDSAAKKAEEAKKKAEEAVNEASQKAAPTIQKAEEYAKDFAASAIDFVENTVEKVEDYIEDKIAEEKDVDLSDITEDFFDSDDEEDFESEETVEDDTDEDNPESEETIEDDVDEDDTKPVEIDEGDNDVKESNEGNKNSSEEKPKRPVNEMSLEEFMDGIVEFEKAEKKPDISEQTEGFLIVIKYFASDISKSAFKAAVNLPKITYESVISGVKKDFPRRTKKEIRDQLQLDYQNWVNVRYPEIKKICPNANCMTLIKYWAKNFNKF